jgi:hypothetical protein
MAAMAAGVALAMTGAGAGVALAVTAPSEPVPPAATPTVESGPPDMIGPGRLLTAEDLGPGQWRTDDWDGPEWEDTRPPGWPPEDCLGTAARSVQRVDLGDVAWSTGPVTEQVQSDWVYQVVELFEPGDGQAVFAAVREAAVRCEPGGATTHPGYSILDSGFAGDESLLLRQETYSYEGEELAPEPGLDYVALVRVGDAVATVDSFDGELMRADPGYLREVAQRAADRLRQGG